MIFKKNSPRSHREKANIAFLCVILLSGLVYSFVSMSHGERSETLYSNKHINHAFNSGETSLMHKMRDFFSTSDWVITMAKGRKIEYYNKYSDEIFSVHSDDPLDYHIKYSTSIVATTMGDCPEKSSLNKIEDFKFDPINDPETLTADSVRYCVYFDEDISGFNNQELARLWNTLKMSLLDNTSYAINDINSTASFIKSNIPASSNN